VRDAGERDHGGAPLGERVALVAVQALARVALAAEQSGGFLAGAREPLAAQTAAALGPKADMCGAVRDVRYGPKADIAGGEPAEAPLLGAR
jgi:hypothetical protein